MKKETVNQIAKKYFKEQIAVAVGWMSSIEDSLSDKDIQTMEKAKRCLLWMSNLMSGRTLENGAVETADELKQCAEAMLEIAMRPDLWQIDMERLDEAYNLMCIWAGEMQQDEEACLKK